MSKTNILIFLENKNGYFRVKLDKNKFPYIIIDNERITITEFQPKEIKSPYGDVYKIIKIENKEESTLILQNPNLTLDKLSLKQLFRLFYKG